MYLPSGLNERRVGGRSTSPDNVADDTERRHVHDVELERLAVRSTVAYDITA